MVDNGCEDVKRPRGAGTLIQWIECHPRTGWYIAVFTTINTILGLVGLLH